MTPQTDDEIEKEFNEFIVHWCSGDWRHLLDTDDNDGEKFRQNIRTTLATVRKEAYESGARDTEKAFGGCKKCYGKGYGTQTLYARGRGESDMGQGHIVIDQKLPTMVFCECDRGRQLENLLDGHPKGKE